MAALNADCSPQPGDIWKQVNQFLQGVTHDSAPQVSFESLSSSALFLLRTVPVARHAVLEHYSNVFDDAVNTYLSTTEMGTKAVQENQLTALQDVTGVLLAFINSNPEAWAPVVSSWSLSLLGQMSSRYAKRRGIQHATCLNEVLQMWMACPPAKMLIEITTDCFAAMVGGAPDRCVDSLLEASVCFSPHFDWVVAHIGSCFPTTIITRVLNCGLKDFCTSSRENIDRDTATSSRMKIPKMESVVGILEHLASKHGPDIRKALMVLFESSLIPPLPTSALSSSPSSSNQPVTTLPFLLELAQMSSMLLTILTTDLVSALTPAVLNKLHQQFTQWKRVSPSDYNSFLNVVVHLIGKGSSGAFAIINFVLTTAIPHEASLSHEETVCDAVRDTCSEIMHILLFELQRGVMSRKMDGSVPEIPLLVGLARQIDLLISTLVQSQGKRFECMLKLVTFTGLHASEDVAASMLAYIAFHAQTQQQLLTFYKLKDGLEMGFPSVVQSALVLVFQKLYSPQMALKLATPSSSSLPSFLSSSSSPSSSLSKTLQTLRNLEKIVSVENAKLKKKSITSSLIICSMRERHATLLEFVLCDDISIRMCALKLMSQVEIPRDLDPALLTKLCGAVVSTFFNSLHQRSCQQGKSLRMRQLCMDCIRQLSYFQFTKSLLIHYLVEGAVDESNCCLFGGKETSGLSSSSSSLVDPTSLLEQNKAQNLSISLPRSHSSVHHGGVIQQTRRNTIRTKHLSKREVWENRITLVETLWMCGKDVNGQIQKIEPQDGGVETEKKANQEEPMDTSNNVASSSTPSSTPSALSTKETSSADASATPSNTSLCVMSESAARTLGCVLVDILTQDSLYNDVCWPDPDFRKVTTERDIQVWKNLDELSFLWDIIQEFSSSCVFLYYLSPVLRSITGTLMNSFEVCREKKMTNQPKQYEAAIKLVACLGQGLLIPAPLYNISELFPFVSPYEGYLLLLAVWLFIKDNPPSEFESDIKMRKCNESHTQVLTSIIHANIDKMGHLCPRILDT